MYDYEARKLEIALKFDAAPDDSAVIERLAPALFEELRTVLNACVGASIQRLPVLRGESSCPLFDDETAALNWLCNVHRANNPIVESQFEAIIGAYNDVVALMYEQQPSEFSPKFFFFHECLILVRNALCYRMAAKMVFGESTYREAGLDKKVVITRL